METLIMLQQAIDDDEVRPQNRTTLQDYVKPDVNQIGSSIVRHGMQANNFEIKPSLVQMFQNAFQFSGLPTKDPSNHMDQFLEFCDNYKQNGVSNETIRLRLFPFTLKDKAKKWLQNLPPKSITIQDKLANIFIGRFFLPTKTIKMRNDIYYFLQINSKPFYEAWERMKDTLRMCHHHGLPNWLVIQKFYYGLNTNTRNIMAKGSFRKKEPEQAYDLLDELAIKTFKFYINRISPRRTIRVHEIDTISVLQAQVDVLNGRLDTYTTNSVNFMVQMCENYVGNHEFNEWPMDYFLLQAQHINYMG